MKIVITVPVEVIADGTKVRKPSGAKEYTVRREIRFYGGAGGMTVSPVLAERGTAFLCAKDGTVNCVPADMLVTQDLLIRDAYEFLRYLEENHGIV